VKICGITSVKDARIAVECGADALGFIFFSGSKRYIVPEKAAEIIATLPGFVSSVGVFVNAPMEEVERIVQLTRVSTVQFHGDETPQFVRQCRYPSYKTLRATPDFSLESIRSYPSNTFLMEPYVEGVYGGTGRVMDWRMASRACEYGNLILAGGLSPENIEYAITTVRPYAVDVNSGVEQSPGKKDRRRIEELFLVLYGMQRKFNRETVC